MREALEQVLDHAFGPLGLHRIEANIQPGNAPSIALARGAGFRLEGFSPRYLLIGGQWRDHERYAITADEHAAARAAAAQRPLGLDRPRERWPRHWGLHQADRRFQGLLEVGPEVLDVLAADAHADQAGRDVLLAGEGAAALHRRLHAAEARRVPDDLGRGAGAVARRRRRPRVSKLTHRPPKPG